VKKEKSEESFLPSSEKRRESQTGPHSQSNENESSKVKAEPLQVSLIFAFIFFQ